MPFLPISALFSKINARNINYMAALNFRKCLDLRKNCYNPTLLLEENGYASGELRNFSTEKIQGRVVVGGRGRSQKANYSAEAPRKI